MLRALNSSVIPPALRHPALFDTLGVPRYWASVWMCFNPEDQSDSTISKYLGYIESLYAYADTNLGAGGLDDALAKADVSGLGQVLDGFFVSIRNEAKVTETSDRRWQVALRFVRETLTRIAESAQTRAQFSRLEAKLKRLEVSHSPLRVQRHHKVEQLRSLPASVVEALYEMLDPSVAKSPFRNGAGRARAFVLFIVMLHLGLRRGELLIQPADAVKSAFDRRLDRERLWLNVTTNEYEDDPRYTKPSIKTATSVRQIPVSESTAKIIDEYIWNYRGRPAHSFLLNSQKNRPLSTERVTTIFQQISDSLPKSAVKELHDRTGKCTVTPHDLRHTCAVVRLNQFLTRGDSHDEAMQKMRSFFGWSRSSDMPRKYARAVYEDRVANVWNNVFDDRVAVLSNIPKGS